VIRRAIFATMLVGGAAHADDKADCVAASDQAQDLRAQGKLVKAHEQLLACSRDACPAVIARDCGQWLREVEHSLPSIAVSVRDAHGGDLIEVTVFMDGAVWLESLDGRAHAIDPGPHELRFEWKGGTPVKRQVLVRQGEQERQLTVILESPAGPTPAPALVVPPTEPAPASGGGWMRPTGLVVAGFGAAAIITGAVLGGVALGDWGTAIKTCPTGSPCADPMARQSQSDAGTLADWSTGLMVGGGIATVGGLLLFFIAPKAPVTIAPVQNGWAFSLRGNF